MWTPAADGRRRPVVVWLHGGAWQSGGGALDWYDGARLAALGDVVVVAVNYRLAALGWLHQPGQTANVGLLDQECAIDWVLDHIQDLGGDPARVTPVSYTHLDVYKRQLQKEALGLAQSFFGEGYRFRSIGGTGNQATFMKSVKHVPIEPLPSAVVVMQGQIQKCQDGIIDSVGVDIPGIRSDTLGLRKQNRLRNAKMSLILENGRQFTLRPDRYAHNMPLRTSIK